MPVYTVTMCVAYEGDTLLGVFTDQEKAERFAWEADAPYRALSPGVVSDISVEITEYGEADPETSEMKPIISWVSPRMPPSRDFAPPCAETHRAMVKGYEAAVRRFGSA